jgi:hypothetical protein
MTRDAGLPHAQNFLQLRHGKLVLLQEEKEPEPRRIGEEAEKING